MLGKVATPTKVENPATLILSTSVWPLTSNAVRVPRLVKEELTTLVPKVSLERTLVPLIL